MSTTPDLPYAGTSGHSGGATSQERALRDDSDGTTGERQRRTLALLGRYSYLQDNGDRTGRELGLTWKELASAHAWHHGQASGVLSNLHKVGKIARLTERRDRCFVYVLPEYVDGRETQPHGNPRKRSVLTDLEQARVAGARDSLALGSGVVVPGWRVQGLLEIIDRLAGG